MRRKRIACCRIPKLPIALLSRGGAREDARRPLALLEGTGTRAVVRVVGETAARDGVRPGMSLPVARGRCPRLIALPDDPALRRAEQRGIATALLCAAPRVTVFGSDAFLCDARGMDRLGGETALTTSILEVTAALGHPNARVGVADTAVAARAATMLPRVRVRHVPHGTDAAFLSPLPLSVLTPPPDLTEALHTLGVYTCGHLAALDVGSITARWGPEGATLHRRARGIDDRGPSPPPDDTLPTAHLELGGPVEGTSALVFVWKPLVERVIASSHGRWIATLRLTLHLDDRSERVLLIEPAAPTGKPDVLASLLRDAMEEETLTSPVVAVTLVAKRLVPPVPVQTGLFDLDRGERDPIAREAALSRLVGRYGPDSVVRPVAVDDPLPEARGKYEPVAKKKEEKKKKRPARPPRRPPRTPRRRPPGPGPYLALRLAREPTPIEVRTGPKGPVAIRLEGRWRRVIKRPWVESLRSRWWVEPDRERLDHRVVLEGGLLVWLSEDPKEKSWKLMGWYD